MKLRINRWALVAGIQNLWQIGLIFPLNVLANAYFIFKSRFRVRTSLDILILLYIFAGFVSLASGFILALANGADPYLLANSFKSFLVFLCILVFFAGYVFYIEAFFSASLLVVSLIAIGVLLTYVGILYFDPVSLYLARGAIKWLPGWPQRWVMFALVGYFVFLCRYDFTKKKIDLAMLLVFLSITILSATRSALIGLLAGQLILSFLSIKDAIRTWFVIALLALVAITFSNQLESAFRISELASFSSSDSTQTSVGNRLNNIWPGIVDSLGVLRIPFGWGHAGVAYIPHHFFADRSLMSDAPGAEMGTAESQYMDVLERQGLVGLILFVMILFFGMYYSYRLYRCEGRGLRRALWKASLAWQGAIFFHGVTVSTVRFPVYGLFFYLFLGILSTEYYYLHAVRKKVAGSLRGTVERHASYLRHLAGPGSHLVAPSRRGG